MFKRKKILAFSMLLIVAVPLFFFIGFVVKERMIKNEMRDNLETSSLKTIIVNEADVQWADENKEVIINGNLFDVKSYTVADGKITLTGLFDTDEVTLHSQLQNFMQQKDDSNTPLNQMAFKFLFSPLYINSAAATYQNTLQIAAQHFLPFIENSLPENYLSKSGPPPKIS
jgi:hypothetical protein